MHPTPTRPLRARTRHRLTPLAVAPVALVAGALWWRWARDATPGSDARLLLAVARQIAAGAGPRLPDGEIMTFRGPGWPALVGVLVRLLGEGAGVAAARAVAAGALGASLVALGRAWYGWGPGLLALLLAASAAPVLEVLADWYADPLAVAVALVGVVVLDGALRRASTGAGVAAGALLAAAVLVKESAGLAAIGPVAAAIAVSDRHGWGFLRPLAAAVATAMAGIGPWLTLHVALEDRFFLTLVGGWRARVLLAGWWLAVAVLLGGLRMGGRWDPARWARPPVGIATAVAAAVVALWAAVVLVGLAEGVPLEARSVPFGPGEIVRRELLPALGPLPLVALGLAGLGLGLVRRERSAVAHAATLAAFTPVLVIWAWSGSLYIARNGLVAVLGVHLAAAAATWRLLRLLGAGLARTRRGWPVRIGAVGLATVLAATIVVALAGAWNAAPDRSRRALGDLDDAAAWLRPRLAPGEGVVGSYLAWTRLAWRLSPPHPVHLLPAGQVRVGGDGTLRSVPQVPVVGTPRPVVVPVGTDDWILLLRHRTKGILVALSRDRLVTELRRARARHLVLWGTSTRDGPELVATLASMPGTRPVATFGEAVVLQIDVARLARGGLPPAATRPDTVSRLVGGIGPSGCVRTDGPAVGWPPRPAGLVTCGRLLLHTDRPRTAGLGGP